MLSSETQHATSRSSIHGRPSDNPTPISQTIHCLPRFAGQRSQRFGRPRAPPDPLPQELLQGPLHEAFGQPVVFNTQPGIIVPKRPPDPIEEMAPDQKPEGDNVIWISGYWSWDDQRQDFIWISGFWRVVPPGKTWLPGYWAPSGDRFQWVSGFWTSADVRNAEYLPPPPASLETGPSSQPPSANVIWAPGTWVYRDNRYAWRPGSWINGQANWVWIPAHYEWTPSGHVFIDGYWDYEVHRRGLLVCAGTVSAGSGDSSAFRLHSDGCSRCGAARQLLIRSARSPSLLLWRLLCCGLPESGDIPVVLFSQQPHRF